MFNPCYEHCYLRWGKQYAKKCDDNCVFAKVCLENRELKGFLDKLFNELGIDMTDEKGNFRSTKSIYITTHLFTSNTFCHFIPTKFYKIISIKFTIIKNIFIKITIIY